MANTWFLRLTSGANTWALREEALPNTSVAPAAGVLLLIGQTPVVESGEWGEIDGVGLLLPAEHTVELAAAATVVVTALAALRVVVPIPPPPAVEVIPLPENIVPAQARWRLVTRVRTDRSPLNGTTQTVSAGGEHWAVTLTYRNLKREPAAVLLAALTALRGTYNRITLPDHAYVRRGALAVNLAVQGGAQTGTALDADGGTPGVSDAVRAGDWFTLEDRLYMVAEDADTDGTGAITLAFEPPLTESPADDATINLLAPTARFMLADNRVSWSYVPGGFTSFNSIDLLEDRT